MTLWLPERRRASNPNCSSVPNELDCAHPTLDSLPSSRVGARETPIGLNVDDLYRLWLTNRHMPKSGICEDTLDSQASAQHWERLHSPRPPAIQHRGWLLEGLLSIPYKRPAACTFPISFHFSDPNERRRDGESSRQQPRTSQKTGQPSDIKIALSKKGLEHATPLTGYSSCGLIPTDGSAPLFQASAVNTKHKDETARGSRRSAEDSPIVPYNRAESTNTFIFSEDLASVFPFDSLALLEQDPQRCIATTELFLRCKNDMPDRFSMSAAEFSGIVRDISKESCMMSQLGMLESLSKKILCRKGQHSKRAGRSLQGPRANPSARDNANGPGKADSGLCTVSMKALPSWLKALSSCTTVCEQSCVMVADDYVLTSADRLTNKDSREGSTSLAITRSEASTLSSQRSSSAVVRASATSSIHSHRVLLPASLHCGPQKFQQWRPNSWLTVPQLIRQTLEKQIGKRSQDAGYVYIYWNRGNFGYVKIGFTAATTVEGRLSQWRRECNHDVEEYIGAIGRQRVPHVYRVECLVLAELRDFRLKELNCPCGSKEHQEWCKIGPQHVAKVRQKWEAFMLEQERYESRGSAQFLRHTLSDKELDRLCRPLPVEQPASPNKKKASSGLRRSPCLREKERASA